MASKPSAGRSACPAVEVFVPATGFETASTNRDPLAGRTRHAGTHSSANLHSGVGWQAPPHKDSVLATHSRPCFQKRDSADVHA